LTVIVPVLVAIIGGLFAWIAGNKKGHADVQTVINDGFTKLLNEANKDRDYLKTEVTTFHSKFDLQNRKIDSLEESVTILSMHINELERIIVMRGEQPPVRPTLRVV
jgi:peptidoglycan hydrolase CwlO-like protein